MFENLGWWEIAALILLALFIFGPDRLPKFIADTTAVLRRIRRMATEATSDLRDQLGPDVELEDLHPKRFVRKHLLSEEDERALRRPFEEFSEELTGTRAELEAEFRRRPRLPADSDESEKSSPPRFDPDAT